MNLPETFYKYTTAETALKVLESGKFRWSNPFQFNDLTELQRTPKIHPSIEDSIPEFIKTIVECAYNELNLNIEKLTLQGKILISLCQLFKKNGILKADLITKLMLGIPKEPSTTFEEEIRQNVASWGNEYSRIFCVTTDPSNEVMWAHYSANNSGCVLGLRHLPEYDTPLLAARPIDYKSGPPIVCSGLEFLLYGDNAEIRSKSFDAICFTKDIKWSYESEWRVITWRYDEIGKSHGDYKFFSNELESVTFGAKTESSIKNKISNIISSKYSKCEVYEITAEKGSIQRIKKS